MISNEFDSSNLVFKPTHEGYAEGIFSTWAQDLDVVKFLNWTPHKSIQDTLDWIGKIKDAVHNGKNFHYMVLTKTTNVLLGSLVFRVSNHGIELGYVVAKKFWGQGFGTEIVSTAIKISFTNPEIYRVWAYCHHENLASLHVMQKAGMTKEGILRSWVIFPNLGKEPSDAIICAITKNDYLAMPNS